MSNRKVCADCPLKNSRSIQVTRLFFDLLAKAYDHWPLSSKFKPDNVEHLRAYLLVKAKHSVTERVEIAGQVYPEHIKLVVTGLIRAIGTFCFIRIAETGEYFDVAHPKSMSFDKLGEKQFNEVMQNVLEIIEVDYIPGFLKEHRKK